MTDSPENPLPAPPPAPQTSATPRPKRRRVFRLVLAAVLLLLAIAILPSMLRREDPSRAFAAMPEGTLAVSRHFDLSATWRKQITTPVVSEIFRFFGGNARKVAKEDGTDWIIRITTGHSTTAAVTVPQDGEEDFILYGASFTGAREPILRLMMLFHWIPGVGRLRTSEHGTIYLDLKDLDEDNADLKVGFALTRHTLLASFAKSPEHVRVLERRLNENASPSPALFNGDAEPWKTSEGTPHTFWLHAAPGSNAPAFVPPVSATFGVRLEDDAAGLSARLRPGDLPFLPQGLLESPPLSGRTAKGSSLAAGSAFAMLLLPSPFAAPLLAQALHLPASRAKGGADDAALYLNGQPYGGSAVHVTVPAATLLCPGVAVSRRDVELALPAIKEDTGVHFRWKKARGDGVLLDWLGSKGLVKLSSKECVFVECPEKGAAPDLLLCSAAGSLDAQRVGTPPESPAWQDAYAALRESSGSASPRAFFYLDLATAAYEARQIIALARLVADFGLLILDKSDKDGLKDLSRFLEGFHDEGSLGLLLSTQEGAPRLDLSIRLSESEQL